MNKTFVKNDIFNYNIYVFDYLGGIAMEISTDSREIWSLLGMHSPFLMKDMQKTLNRLVKAINERERIVICGYCDLDSIAGVSLLLLTLKYLNADVEYYIPDVLENTKGNYNEDIINYIKLLGSNLIITVGIGVSSASQIDIINKLNTDTIIIDCKTPYSKITNAMIIDPLVAESKYPLMEMSVSSVAFKLVQALGAYYQIKCINKYLDLILIGTIASKVPIKDENKIIVDNGLYKLMLTHNYGLKAIMNTYNTKNSLSSISEFVYQLIKKFDSANCEDNARILIELFTTNDKDRAIQIAKYLKKETENKQIKNT